MAILFIRQYAIHIFFNLPKCTTHSGRQRRLHKRSHRHSYWYILHEYYIYCIFCIYLIYKFETSTFSINKSTWWQRNASYIVGWVAFWPSAWLSAWFMCTALVEQKFERKSKERGVVGHGLSMCPLECSTQLDSCNLLWQTCLLSILTMILPPKHTHTHKLPPTRTCWSLCVSYIIRAPRAGTHTHSAEKDARGALALITASNRCTLQV